MAAGEISVAGENAGPRVIVHHDRVATLSAHNRYDDMAKGSFLECANQLGQVARPDQRLIGERDDDCIEGAVQRSQPYAHRALLSVGMCLVVGERYHKASHLFLDCMPRVPGNDDDLVDAGAAQGDQMPADQRYPL